MCKYIVENIEFRMKLKIIFFLCLLILLVLWVIFVYNVPEGMIQYQYSSDKNGLNSLKIPQYGKSVFKLYDSIYFDNYSGNVIELFGNNYDSSSPNNIDTTGSSLTFLTLLSRGSTTTGSISTPQINTFDLSMGIMSKVPESFLENQIRTDYKNWTYPTSSDLAVIQSKNTKTTPTPIYQIFNISWGLDTIIHLYEFDQSKGTNIGTYLFSQNTDPVHTLSTCMIPMPTISSTDTNHETKYTSLNEYCKGKEIFQVFSNVYFDTTNRYLIVKNTKGFTIYNGTNDTNGPVKQFTDVASVDTVPATFSNHNFEVLYIPVSDSCFVLYVKLSNNKTLVVVFTCDSANSKLLSIINLVRFNPDSTNGVDGLFNISPSSQKTSSTDTQESHETHHKSHEKVSDSDSNSNGINSDFATYVKMMNYMGNIGGNIVGSGSGNGGKISEDYLLKTQIVPQVSCPSCPSCPANNCNCGVTGGGVYGVTHDGSYNTHNLNINPNTNLGIASAVQNLGYAGDNVLNSVVNTGSNIGGKTLSGAERIGNDLLYGGERVGKDILNTLKWDPMHVNNNQQTSGVTSSIHQDGSNNHLYSTYQPNHQGVFVPMGGGGQSYLDFNGNSQSQSTANYIPILNDFSRFSK